ncbi:DUF3592 domain-containing protein [Actinomycetes bacterium KLBMP 9797]
MRGTSGGTPGWSKGNSLLVSGFGCFLCLGMAFHLLSEDQRLNTRGMTTEAEIVVVSTKGRADKVIVEFDSHDGLVVKANCRCPADEMAVGDTVQIRYDRSAPWDTVEQVGHRSARTLAIFALAGSAVLFIVAMVMLYQVLWGSDGW